MHRHLPPLPAVQGPVLKGSVLKGSVSAYPRAATGTDAACQQATERARRVEAEALGTGLDDAGQPPAVAPFGGSTACAGKDGGPDAVATASDKMGPDKMGHDKMGIAPLGKTHKTHASRTHAPLLAAQQARVLRRQIERQEHGDGPQYNPHRDDRRPAAHQADSGNDWHQAS